MYHPEFYNVQIVPDASAHRTAVIGLPRFSPTGGGWSFISRIRKSRGVSPVTSGP